MIEAVIEIILQLSGELLIQIFGELFIELGWRSVGESFKRQPNPVLATIGHLILGAIAGGISLLIFPKSFVAADLKLLNLIATPLLAGVCMAIIGALLKRRGRTTLRIESFGYGFAFAFALNLVRFFFAT
jgi:hypothetical protein